MKKNEEDVAAISQILEEHYFKNIYEGDAAALEGVFHPKALLFGDVKGQCYQKTVAEYIDGVAHRQSPKESGQIFTGEIVSVSVVNSIAVAVARVKMYDFNYHEFLSFHKIKGHWLLVNKMISDVNP